MAVAVEADPVAGVDDLRGQDRGAGDLLADEEEGRPDPAVGEQSEDGRGPLGMGSVVEGQGHPGPVESPLADAEGAAQRREVERGARQEVGAGEGGGAEGQGRRRPPGLR